MTDRELLLMDYVLGQVSQKDRASIEHDLTRDVALQKQVKELQDLLVQSSPKATVFPELHKRILASVHPQSRFSGFAERLASMTHISIERAHEVIDYANRFPEAPWEASRVPGMHALHFSPGETLSAKECGVVHMEPGTVFPHHSHHGQEVAMILQGEFCDDDGTTYLPGDVFYKNSSHVHSYQATGDVPLIFVVYHNGIEVT